MFLKRLYKNFEKIKKNYFDFLSQNFSSSFINILEVIIFIILALLVIYFIFVAFTEILLLLILLVLIMIYKKLSLICVEDMLFFLLIKLRKNLI